MPHHGVHGNTNGNYIGLLSGLRDRDENPQFRDPAKGDFSLSTTSQLLDAAHPIVAVEGWLAADEPVRWQNDLLDFGATEVAVDVAPWLAIRSSPVGPTATLTVFGYPGLYYDVEASTDFENWKQLGTAFTVLGKYDFPLEPVGTNTFFRARTR